MVSRVFLGRGEEGIFDGGLCNFLVYTYVDIAVAV